MRVGVCNVQGTTPGATRVFERTEERMEGEIMEGRERDIESNSEYGDT